MGAPEKFVWGLVIGAGTSVPLLVFANHVVEGAAWGFAFVPVSAVVVFALGPGLVAIVGMATKNSGVVAGAALAFFGNLIYWGMQFKALDDHYAANVKTVDALNQLPSAAPRQPHDVVIIVHPDHDWLFGGPQNCIAGCMQMLLTSPYAVAFEQRGSPSTWQVFRNPASAAECDAPALTASRIAFIQQRYAHRCAIPSHEPAGDDGLVIDFDPGVAIPTGANAGAFELRERIKGQETLLGREASDVNTPPKQQHALAELLPASMHFPESFQPIVGPDTSEALVAALVPLIEQRETREQASTVFDYLLGYKGESRAAFTAAALRFMQSSDPGLVTLGVRTLRLVSPEDRARAWPMVLARLDDADPIVVAAALNLFYFYDDKALQDAWPAVARLATTRSIPEGAGLHDDAIVGPLLRVLARHPGAFETSAQQAALARLGSTPAPSESEILVAYAFAAHGSAETDDKARAALVRLPPGALFEIVMTVGYPSSQWRDLLNHRDQNDFWSAADLTVLAERANEMSDEKVGRYVIGLCRQKSFYPIRSQVASMIQARLDGLRKNPDTNRSTISELEELFGYPCRI